jgi:hypothetical protein
MSNSCGEAPETWDKDEQIGERASEWYDKKRGEIDALPGSVSV